MLVGWLGLNKRLNVGSFFARLLFSVYSVYFVYSVYSVYLFCSTLLRRARGVDHDSIFAPQHRSTAHRTQKTDIAHNHLLPFVVANLRTHEAFPPQHHWLLASQLIRSPLNLTPLRLYLASRSQKRA